jgi:hypothetical protein
LVDKEVEEEVVEVEEVEEVAVADKEKVDNLFHKHSFL